MLECDTDRVHARRSTRRHRRIRRDRAERVAVVVAIVCSAYQISQSDLLRASRGVARIAFARQVAMYVSHIWLGMSLSAVGRTFGRDRTTVAHACRLVEDARDDAGIDHILNVIEAAADGWQDNLRHVEDKA